MFTALVLDSTDAGVSAEIRELDDGSLPDGDITVSVEWSSLNYKDGLVLGGLGRLVRDYPHVGGIDLAGIVESSSSPAYAPGDRVLATGWRIGELRWGGFATRARLKAEWLTPIPDGLSARQAMAVGTAGLAAMLAVEAVEQAGVEPGDAPVLVTGAAGGVGMVAVHLLARLGYTVTASTGRVSEQGTLRALGAAEIVDRAETSEPPAKPLLSERWAACVDAVGGSTLARALTELRYGGVLAACGNAGGNDCQISVLPLILRAVRVLGVDTVMLPAERRPSVWSRIAELVDPEILESFTSEIELADLPAAGGAILEGSIRGRTVVRLP